MDIDIRILLYWTCIMGPACEEGVKDNRAIFQKPQKSKSFNRFEIGLKCEIICRQIINEVEMCRKILVLHKYFLLFIIFYEFLVFPHCVGLMDNGKLLELFRCKGLFRYRGENT